jgi:quinoprotein glucose dehydrogenase
MDSVFRAYDSRTGKVLWETYLGGGVFATPSTYMAGASSLSSRPSATI